MFKEITEATSRLDKVVSNTLVLNDYELVNRMTYDEIDSLLKKLDGEHSGDIAILKSSGDRYLITETGILNINGTAVVCIHYVPMVQFTGHEGGVVKRYIPRYTNKHCRPATEFFDGRFIINKKITEKLGGHLND